MNYKSPLIRGLFLCPKAISFFIFSSLQTFFIQKYFTFEKLVTPRKINLNVLFRRINGIILISMVLLQANAFAQCSECGSPRTYVGSTTTVSTNSGWGTGGNFTSGQIAKFTDGRSYDFSVSNPFDLGGIILSGGSSLTMDKSSQGNTPAFTITNGCIVVGAGSTLNLIYFNEMSNLTICVEDGGTINFDSRSRTGERDVFSFEGVTINLQGSNSTLNFGDADIQIDPDNGLNIQGWVGSEFCNGSSAPSSGNSGNISWTSNTANICDVLNGRVLPIDLIDFSVKFQEAERQNLIRWKTGKEWENSHFEIKRSIDNISDWETIGIVSGAGFSEGTSSYSFTDNQLPLAGGIVYYQLKQVDFNGQYSESKAISIKTPKINGVSSWVVYPNPSSTTENINLALREKDEWKGELITIKIIDFRGNIFSKFAANPIETSEIVSDFFKCQTAGMYLIDLNWGLKNQKIKVWRK